MMVETSAVCIVGYPSLQLLLQRFAQSACHLWYVIPQLSIIDALTEEYVFNYVAMDIPLVEEDWNILHMLRDKYTMTDDVATFRSYTGEHVRNTNGLFKLFTHI